MARGKLSNSSEYGKATESDNVLSLKPYPSRESRTNAATLMETGASKGPSGRSLEKRRLVPAIADYSMNGFRALKFPVDSNTTVNALVDTFIDHDLRPDFDVLTGAWVVTDEVANYLGQKYKYQDVTREWKTELKRNEGYRIFLMNHKDSEAFIVDYETKGLYYYNAGDIRNLPHPGFVTTIVSQSSSRYWKAGQEIYGSVEEAVHTFMAESRKSKKKNGS